MNNNNPYEWNMFQFVYHGLTWIIFNFLLTIGIIISLTFLISGISYLNGEQIIKGTSLGLSIFLMLKTFLWTYNIKKQNNRG